MGTGMFRSPGFKSKSRHIYTMYKSGAVGWSLDMTNQNANMVKYINSSNGTKKQLQSNCKVFWQGMAVAMVHCTADIKKGDELLADY